MTQTYRRSGLAFFAGLTLLASFAAHAIPFDWVPPGIKALTKGDGWMFADTQGMTLYTFDRDEGAHGKSACNGPCEKAWPAMLAPADAEPHAPWSIVVRADGARQWAYRGRPLYRYVQDPAAGATYGDGVSSVWHVAYQQLPTPGGVSVGYSSLGRVLTDRKGLTLYTSEADRVGKATCNEECLKNWRPVAAPWLANPFADFSVVTRADGFRQWAYRGKALYRSVADVTPGETAGQANQGWHAVVLEPAPPLPSWATIEPSDAGELVADGQGHTVYTYEANGPNRLYGTNVPAACKGKQDCYDPQFVPFIAGADAKPTGSWSLVKRADGQMQWAYKGMKVFTNVNDQTPGDFKGIRFGGDRAWAAVMRSGQPMQGTTVGG